MSHLSKILPSSQAILAEIDLRPTQIRQAAPAWKRTHYRAAINWLTRYTPQETTASINQVRGLLEAFYHFHAVEDLQKASTLLTIQLNTPTHDEFHNQLYSWGYCQEQIQLYEPLVGKLDVACDAIFLNGLGLAYRSLGNYQKASDAYDQSITLASQLQDIEGYGIGLLNLSEIYCLQNKLAPAQQLGKEALTIAIDTHQPALQAGALAVLGLICQSASNYPQAIKYHQQILNLTDHSPAIRANALAGLGLAHNGLEQNTQAIECYQQALIIFQQLEDRFGEGTMLGNIGATYAALADYQKAADYAQQHLIIAQAIDDQAGKIRAQKILQDIDNAKTEKTIEK